MKEKKQIFQYRKFEYARMALPEEGFEIDSNSYRVMMFAVSMILLLVLLFYFDIMWAAVLKYFGYIDR